MRQLLIPLTMTTCGVLPGASVGAMPPGRLDPSQAPECRKFIAEVRRFLGPALDDEDGWVDDLGIDRAELEHGLLLLERYPSGASGAGECSSFQFFRLANWTLTGLAKLRAPRADQQRLAWVILKFVSDQGAMPSTGGGAWAAMRLLHRATESGLIRMEAR